MSPVTSHRFSSQCLLGTRGFHLGEHDFVFLVYFHSFKSPSGREGQRQLQLPRAEEGRVWVGVVVVEGGVGPRQKEPLWGRRAPVCNKKCTLRSTCKSRAVEGLKERTWEAIIPLLKVVLPPREKSHITAIIEQHPEGVLRMINSATHLGHKRHPRPFTGSIQSSTCTFLPPLSSSSILPESGILELKMNPEMTLNS